MNSINLLIVIFACLGYTDAATLRGFPIQANDYMIESLESSGYETICKKRPPYETCRDPVFVFDYAECNPEEGEIGVGVWTANPDCCNDVPHTCSEESTCEFDNEDVEYWHCIFCCTGI